MCVSFFETQCERDDNQMRDDWNEYNHSGEVFSRGQIFFSISSLTSSQLKSLSFVILQYIRINQLLTCLVIPSLPYLAV